MIGGVSEVLRVSDELIEPLPPMVSSVNSVFLKGIVRFEDRLIILLELDNVLYINEQQALEVLTL